MQKKISQLWLIFFVFNKMLEMAYFREGIKKEGSGGVFGEVSNPGIISGTW